MYFLYKNKTEMFLAQEQVLIFTLKKLEIQHINGMLYISKIDGIKLNYFQMECLIHN